MRRILAILAFLAAPAWGDEHFEYVTDLLDDADVVGLETVLARMHKQSVRDRDPSELRALYAQIFATTHPQRNAVVFQWRAQLPMSPYAAAAEAWSAIATTRQLGQGDHARPLYAAARKRATDAAGDATRLSSDFAPGLEAWLATPYRADERSDAAPVIGRLLAVGPDRATMLQIMRAVDRYWVSFSQDVLEFCAIYGPMVADYSPDQCVIDAAIKMKAGWGLRDAAVEAMASTDDLGAPDTRGEAALRHDLPIADAAANAVVWHRATLAPGQPVDSFVGEAGWIGRKFDLPDYALTAEATVLDFIDRRLRDDPMNPELIAEKVRLLYLRYRTTSDATALHEARAAWPDAMAFGQYNPRIWELGALLEGADRHVSDVAPRIPYWVNTIAHSYDGKYAILMLFNELYAAYQDAETRLGSASAPSDTAPDPESVLAEVRCPMLRAARVMQALCRLDNNKGSLCDSKQKLYAPVPKIVKAGRGGLCDEIARTPLTMLAYRPVSLSEIPALQN